MIDGQISKLVTDFLQGDRRALAKIITLAESTADDDQKLLSSLLAKIAKPARETIRLAISGPPGVGKSTLINTLGQHIIARGFKLAILAVDPSSDLMHGSILGDKTRMKDLLMRDDVFVRPSPAKGALGGVSFSTHDVIFVVEAFGFNFVIVETVGVGQSEMAVRLLCDHFAVIVQPGAGDQLQAMKKGIVERADFIVVNKADGAQKQLAKETFTSLRTRAHEGEKTSPYLAMISALENSGVDEFLQAVIARHDAMKKNGDLEIIRTKNRGLLCEQIFLQACAQKLKALPMIKRACDSAQANVDALGPQIARMVDDVLKKII